MRIVDLFCWTTIRLQVGQVLAGCMLGRLTEVGPCELSTVVPVEEHTRLVSPGQDTCDLDGGVEFFDLCWQWILSEQVLFCLV